MRGNGLKNMVVDAVPANRSPVAPTPGNREKYRRIAVSSPILLAPEPAIRRHFKRLLRIGAIRETGSRTGRNREATPGLQVRWDQCLLRLRGRGSA